MRTPNRVIILLLVVTATSFAVIKAGQDSSATSQQTGQRASAATRFASCIVRVTVDPAILPLDPATVESLLHSSAVAGAAAREVLERNSMDIPWQELIEMEWLNDFSPRPSSTPGAFEQNDGPPEEIGSIYEQRAAEEENAAYDRQMMEELRKIYGAEYLQQMGVTEFKASDKGGRRAGGSARPSGSPSATIRLSVYLPDNMPPMADEFLKAVISHLRSSLSHAYEVHHSHLSDQLRLLQGQYYAAIGAFQGDDRIIERQLDTMVDLSALNSQMPFGEAVEILKKSVAPPLNLVVLWNDLVDATSVNQTTPINIDGMPKIKLGTALDLLVKGLPSFSSKAIWRIKGGAIVIATPGGLGGPGDSLGQPGMEMDVPALAAQRAGLANQLQSLELSLAGQEARRRAIAEQIARTERETEERLARDEVSAQLRDLVGLSDQSLSNLRKQADAGRASAAELAQATENLARARIDLARRREELSRQVGGGQLEQLTAEMSRMVIDRAEKEAQQNTLRRQLAEVQRQLAQASAFDPEAARMRMEREGLDILSRRIGELQMRIANLQPQMVTVIGAN